MKILHIGARNKFTVPFFEFLGKHFDPNEHRFLARGGNVTWPGEYREYLCEKRGVPWLVTFGRMGCRAEKIVIHGLFDPRIIIALFFQPWLLRKTYWVLAGGDLYTYLLHKRTLKWRVKEFFRKFVIRNIGHVVNYNYGDFELLKQWYGIKGRHHKCLAYPSNTVNILSVPGERIGGAGINFQVGNSADRTNNHIEVLERLLEFRDQDIRIFVPMSYGGQENAGYIKEVHAVGERYFGEKFIPMTEFIPLSEYVKFLSKIDIGIFNHQRQQGMGNIRMLLGLGKKVYLRPDVTSWDTLIKDGFYVYDINRLRLERISDEARSVNLRLAKEKFSEKRLAKQWREILCGSSETD